MIFAQGAIALLDRITIIEAEHHTSSGNLAGGYVRGCVARTLYSCISHAAMLEERKKKLRSPD